MELKRLYKKDGNGAVLYPMDSEGRFAPVCNGVQINRLPKNGLQKLTPKIVKRGIKEVWLTMDGTNIIIHDSLTGKDVKFKITDVPGYECLHCNQKIESDRTGLGVRKHIKAEHSGKKSPDPKFNPSGYLYNDFYATQVEG